MPSEVYKRILILCEGQTDLQYAKALTTNPYTSVDELIDFIEELTIA
ncbi:unnamed protein product [marine sediment metagenome]|uniref:Uncharacterized protein n=1 Tax=marine sediment metagenome TaxID=412755 RepID=X1GZN2_9ZZZZ